MSHPPLQRIFEERVEDLVRAEGQGERARTLLAAVASHPWVQACALWRSLGESSGWTCILSRGPEELLPDAQQVEEIAAGRRSADLIPGRGILLSGHGLEAHALAFAGAPPTEDELDWLAALLHVARLIDESEPPAHQDAVETIVPALPQARSAPTEAPLGEPLPTPPRTDPAECLAELVEREAPACERARVQLELEVEPAVREVRVALSPSEFAHAVHNLLVNAREAQETSSDGGWIRIRASVRESPLQLQVAVEDGGPGLPEEIAQALAAHDPEALPGNGLGLAITLGIVLGQHGDLVAGSGPLGGARVELGLPALGRVS